MRCEHQIAVGAYVLDALEPDEQLWMQLHVQECPVCTETVQELEGLPRLLAGVPPPGEEPVAPVPSELAFQRFRRSAAAVPPARRQRRRWWVAAAAAALVVAGAIGAGVVAASGPEPTVASATHDGVHASAAYLAADHGTQVTLELDGVPPGRRCELVAVTRDGRTESAGAWTVGYSGIYHWSGWVSLAPSDLDHWVVRTADGETLVTVPA